jgi:hypothetical protein
MEPRQGDPDRSRGAHGDWRVGTRWRSRARRRRIRGSSSQLNRRVSRGGRNDRARGRQRRERMVHREGPGEGGPDRPDRDGHRPVRGSVRRRDPALLARSVQRTNRPRDCSQRRCVVHRQGHERRTQEFCRLFYSQRPDHVSPDPDPGKQAGGNRARRRRQHVVRRGRDGTDRARNRSGYGQRAHDPGERSAGVHGTAGDRPGSRRQSVVHGSRFEQRGPEPHRPDHAGG